MSGCELSSLPSSSSRVVNEQYCSRCGFVLRDAMISETGKRYCERCISSGVEGEEADRKAMAYDLAECKKENQQLRKENEILRKENEILRKEARESQKTSTKPESLPPSITLFSALAEGKEQLTDENLLHGEVKPVMESASALVEDDEKTKRLEQRINDLRRKQIEHNGKLDDMSAESECSERHVARLSMPVDELMVSGGGGNYHLKKEIPYFCVPSSSSQLDTGC